MDLHETVACSIQQLTGYGAGDLAYLTELARDAIIATRKALHHGMANMQGQTGHRKKGWGYLPWERKQPQADYRYQLQNALWEHFTAQFADSKWDPFMRKRLSEAAAGLVTKAGTCAAFASCVFLWCLMNARH